MQVIQLTDSFGNLVPKNAFIIRSTELSEFTDCRRKWHVSSQHGMNLEPRMPTPALAIGSIMHKGFEYMRLGKDGLAGVQESLQKYRDGLPEDYKFDPDTQAGVEDIAKLTTGLIEYVQEWYAANPMPSKVVEVERRLLVPLVFNGIPFFVEEYDAYGEVFQGAPVYLAAKLDGLEVDDHGNFWVNEDKTISKATNLDSPLPHLNLDIQASLNLWIARQVWKDRSIIGSHYFVVRKQLPSSRVKNPIAARYRILRNQAQQDFYVRLLSVLAQEMYDIAQGTRPAYPSLPNTAGSQCEWKCRITIACEASNRGEDVGFILDSTHVERRPFIEVLREELNNVNFKESDG